MFGIGIVQGLASNDELLLLLTASLSLTTLTGIVIGIALFGMGVVAGMFGYSLLFNLALTRVSMEKFRSTIGLAAGGISVTYGVFIISSALLLYAAQ